MVTETMIEALKPCPFCAGSDVHLRHHQANQMSWVSCVGCGLEAPSETGMNDDEAVAYWNRRTEAALSTDAEPVKVGRFGHHPEPAVDFCIEVEALEGHLFDARHGIGKPGHEPRKIDDDFLRRVSKAMEFIVGGDQIAIAAKATLRALSAQVQDVAGLSVWEGWDKSRDFWSETKHRDEVMYAMFRGPWSMEDAAMLLGFIDRTWPKTPAANLEEKP